MSSGCFVFFLQGGFMFEADRVPEIRDWGGSRLWLSFILLKPFFSYILARFRRHGKVAALTGPAQWTGRGKPGEGGTMPPSLFLSLPHWDQQSTIFSNHSTHTHTQLTLQMRTCRQHTHTHYPVTILWQTHSVPQTDLKIQTTPPVCLSDQPAFPLIHPSAKSKAPQFNLSN